MQQIIEMLVRILVLFLVVVALHGTALGDPSQRLPGCQNIFGNSIR